MRLSSTLIVIAAFAAAATVSGVAATLAVDVIENRSRQDVSAALLDAGIEWGSVDADGLQLLLAGTAPSEATRFRALTIAGSVVDSQRVIDNMNVQDAANIEPPHFSIEILRNGDGISLIGLIPAATDREAIVERINNLAKGAPVADLLETADYPVPDGWVGALEYGLKSLSDLPNSKISIDAERVAITASSASGEEKRKIETRLSRNAPNDLRLALDIKAPRPVITPFTLRFLIEGETARFDACSADTDATRQQILSAATAAGLQGKADCTIGLGVPSPQWGKAVAVGINAVKQLGGGSITFSDADVSLVALPTTPQSEFDRVVGELEADLPDVFSLHSVLPKPVKLDGTGEGSGPPEFIATRSPEGQVQLRGRLTDERVRSAVESYARARFGKDSVYSATRLDEELPDGWPIRVLAALEALDQLVNGNVIVQPDFVDVTGVTGNPDANATIARTLSEKLGEGENFNIKVTYDIKLDPIAGLPTPEECVSQINEALTKRKITFAPGSTEVEGASLETIKDIAELMKDCQDVDMEIGGHTDSQGREEMNQSLSQQRAESVLKSLMARRILTTKLTAKGYGEEVPIADNATEDGREKNRRIEFKLLASPTQPDGVIENTLEAEEKTEVETPNE